MLFLLFRYRRLKSPANTLIVNLALSDMLNGFLHPMAAYSSFKQTWMFGRIGCEMYAALCGLFGLVSIVTLTAIAVERCLVISVKPWYGGILFTNAKAKASIVVIWAYCFGVMSPPMFGWGAFVPEGFLTSCSFDYLSRTASNRSYFLYIFFFGFFLPIFVISVCYAFIMKTIFQNEKDMKRNNVKKVLNKPKKRNDYKAAEMIMFVIAMFLVSWTPYSLIACVGQFGNTDLITPWVSVLPSLFAKASTIYNPAIYGLSHRHFRATLRRIFKKELPRSSGGDRCATNFSRNSSAAGNRRTQGCICLPNNSSEDNSISFTGKKIYLGIPICNHENNRVVYVKKTQSIYGSCNHVDDPDSTYPAIRPNEVSKSGKSSRMLLETASRHTRGRPVVIALNQETASASLVRSLMFRSERSLHQKYQTLVDKENIVRIPTTFCFNYSRPLMQKTVNKSLFNAQTPAFQILDMNFAAVVKPDCGKTQMCNRVEGLPKTRSFVESIKCETKVAKVKSQ
ncbi:hypothetical protein JTE90_018064 [Oedothorax gibbosus]|uniref:G-protein coupled receptors family 1 profile domain-containing protein n=1 Tax=Oedothorax gibbosus TaxID=931172 RepID=A0AAV6TUI7_9ARAC|nr:hypothetical protein JTE90_018064 [Oedothorax gibbosus]